MKTINGKEKFFFGTVKGTKERIYMRIPEWACGRYWSFGYSDNRVHAIKGKPYDPHALLKDYDLAPQIKENLWQFCEQALTIYTLKESADTMGLGGSHMTTHTEKDFILSNCKEYADHLNNVVLPKLLQVFWDTFSV